MWNRSCITPGRSRTTPDETLPALLVEVDASSAPVPGRTKCAARRLIPLRIHPGRLAETACPAARARAPGAQTDDLRAETRAGERRLERQIAGPHWRPGANMPIRDESGKGRCGMVNRALALAIGLVPFAAASCSDAFEHESDAPAEELHAPDDDEEPGTSQSVVQALPYCYGSWRGTVPPYSHFQDLRFGGPVASGTSTSMLAQCKTRIMQSPTWSGTICAGLPSSFPNWTVQTHVGIRQCFNPDDFTTCLPEMATGFSSRCVNGVLQP